jgi:hypothetical protein
VTTVALVLGALLAVACIVVVALPFLREPAPTEDRLDEPDARERRRLELAEERDRALADLKELEFDHRTGKISDDEYRELVGPLRTRAAAALRRSDERVEPKEARISESFPPPDEGDRPEQASIPEAGPTGSRER